MLNKKEITINNIGKEQNKYLNSFKKGEEVWLTENNLFNICKNIFSNVKKHPKFNFNNKKYIPDILINDKIIIEFQGHQHFTKQKNTYKDYLRKDLFQEEGFEYIEIPYFIQLTKNITKFLFNIDEDFSNGYPHGFIHPKSILPCDFSHLGFLRYKEFLSEFPEEVSEQCYKSIIKRAGFDCIPEYIYLVNDRIL